MSFWDDAVKYTSFIINRSPTSANDNRASPMEILTKREPYLRDIVVFGSVFSFYRDPRKNLLANRSRVGVIIERRYETKDYKVFCKRKIRLWLLST